MTWNGATLFRSVDAGATYTALTSTTNAASIGTAITMLGDFKGGNVFDELSTVEILLQSGGTLTSYTEAQALNGAGFCVLGAPGRWEILQYKVATLIGPKTYRLTGLLRGRRGTEWSMGLHQPGDRFSLADPNAWRRPNPGGSEIGLSRMFKGVTAGASVGSTAGQSFTNTAAGLKPYPVVHIGGGRDAQANVTINWVRRTRIDGGWRSGVDVPLGEASESYEVEVWNAGRTGLLRTFTSLTSPTVEYTATHQASDGLTPGAPVQVSIYQLSSVVGRGFEARATV